MKTDCWVCSVCETTHDEESLGLCRDYGNKCLECGSPLSSLTPMYSRENLLKKINEMIENLTPFKNMTSSLEDLVAKQEVLESLKASLMGEE